MLVIGGKGFLKKKGPNKMEVKPVLALPEGLELIGLEQMDESVVITVASTKLAPCCPLCGVAARRVHSRYTRRVADVPGVGQPIRLFLQVRKCFCEEGACPRKIFVERLTPFIDPHGRVTRRLFQVVQVIGLATGGRLGVRVTDRIGIQTSRQTIIRRILALPTDPAGQVIELGVDDFCATRSYVCSCKDSSYGGSYLEFCLQCPIRLNQVRLRQCSRTRKGDLETVRGRDDC